MEYCMEGFSLNAQELQKYEQIRYPLLMIDYVTEVIPGKSAKGYKYFTNNEWFFPIHFPNEPNVPGALQLEAMAQMLTVAITTLPNLAGETTRFISFEVKCKREVLPGERFDIETEVISWRRGICKGKGVAYVNGELACEANMMITIPTVLEQYKPQKKEKNH